MNGSLIHIKIYEMILVIGLRLSQSVSGSFQQRDSLSMSMADWKQTATDINSIWHGWRYRYTKNHGNTGLDALKRGGFNRNWAYFRRRCKRTVCAALRIGFFRVRNYQVLKTVQAF